MIGIIFIRIPFLFNISIRYILLNCHFFQMPYCVSLTIISCQRRAGAIAHVIYNLERHVHT